MVQRKKIILEKTFTKFCIVGTGSFIVNYGFFYFLFAILYLNYLFSSAFGYISGMVFGFYLNKFFTFKSKSGKKGAEITKYFLVYTTSLFLGLFLLRFLVMLNFPVLLANLIVISFTTITNFIGSKYFVFSKSSVVKYFDYRIYKYRYFLRYFIIGLLSLIIEIGIIVSLASITDLRLIMIIGFIIALLFGFILNLKFNFSLHKKENFRAFFFFTFIAIVIYSLNLLTINLFTNLNVSNYSLSRVFTAAIFFMLSYFLHRKITFKNTKKVGVAIYLQEGVSIESIRSKIGNYIDWVHLDLIDKTINSSSPKVDLSIGEKVRDFWPGLEIMTHIMSENPSRWIEKVSLFSDKIIVPFKSKENLKDNVEEIKNLNKGAGLYILSKEDANLSNEILKKIDLIQILAIDNPGNYGEEMNVSTFPLLKKLGKLKKKFSFDICVDGGVKDLNSGLIDSEYLVSGSTILKSCNPRETIYGLKTSLKTSTDKGLKIFLKEKIFEKIGKKEYVKALTLVGSFVDEKGLRGISDLDIVVIIDKLNKRKFNELNSLLKELEVPLKEYGGYNIKINSSFGPLKFNEKNTIVFHLMIYDIESHIEHCIKSPFTCMDWQRSKVNDKERLREIWPLNRLQPNYFFDSRRGLEDYLSDLKKGSISYRVYHFNGGEPKEVIEHCSMSNKDKHEFAFHIMRFCMLNFLKLKKHKNSYIDFEEIKKEYFYYFPKNKKEYTKFIKRLRISKSKNIFKKWTPKNYKLIYSFLKDFEEQFQRFFFDKSKKIYFIRHQKTKMNNKNFFLGQKLNPSIIEIPESDKEKILSLASGEDLIISSPSKRAIETAKVFSDKVHIDELLKEIDYGDAEGKDFSYLKNKFPETIGGWSREEDARFPRGENNSDVEKRVELFLRKISHNRDYKRIFVFSHNVFLRCLLGLLYDIPKKEWHKINVPYLEPMEVILTKDSHFYINLKKEQIRKIFKDFIPI